MNTHLTKVSLALMAAAFLLGCQERGSEPVGPEGLGLQSARKCDSPPCGGGGGGADDRETMIALRGGLSTLQMGEPDAQPAQFTSNRNSIQGGATGDCGEFGCFFNTLDLPAVLTDTENNIGPPSFEGEVTAPTGFSGLENCTTDPENMEVDDAPILARLIDRLDDLRQNRKFYTKINLKSVLAGTKSKVHQIRQDWIDDDGDLSFYSTSLGTHGLRPGEIVIVTEIKTDADNETEFVFSGGSWRSWQRDTPLPGSPHGAFLVCKNFGTVTLTITDL